MVLTVAVAGTAWLVAHETLTSMRQALVERSHAMFGEPPSHAIAEDPDDTTVLDAIVSIYPTFVSEFADWDRRKDPELFDLCAEVREGRKPLAELPQRCEQMVGAAEHELEALAVASQHVRIGSAADWRMLKWWPVARASTASALRARILLERQNSPPESLELCVGMIELWSALTHVTALQSSTSITVLVADAFPVCGAALSHADADTRRDIIDRLAAAYARTAPLSLAVERESLLGEVTIFVPRLSGGPPESLHPAAAERAARSRVTGPTADDTEPWWLEPFVLPPAWEQYLETMANLAEVADQPTGEAIASIDTIVTDESLTHLTRTAVTHRWDRHVRAHHGARSQVELLWAAAHLLEQRAQTGSWPARAPALSSTPIELVTAEHEFTLRTDDGDRVRTLVVRVP